MTTDNSLFLQRSEFLVLMDSVNAEAVVGFRTEELFPPFVDEYRALVEAGIESLQQRGHLAVTPDTTHVLSQEMLTIAQTVAYPQLAVISMRDIRSTGRQIVFHYQRDTAIVEQTLPQEGIHRLALISTPDDLINRLLEIFPVHENPIPLARGELSEEAFFTCKEQAEAGDIANAQQIFEQAGLDPVSAALVIEALRAPVFGGTVAFMRCVNQEIIDARNPLIFRGEDSSWLVAQKNPSDVILEITRTYVEHTAQRLRDWYHELAIPLKG